MKSGPEDSEDRRAFTCAATESAPADARRFVHDVLGDSPHLESAKLVASELVTNAVRHGGMDAGAIDVEIEMIDGVRLAVSQARHTGFVHSIRRPDLDEATGRGLMIVAAVSSEWGIEESTGKVWAVFEEPGKA
jgi:anti-sigma regulatory factor (Ser/Thr protein kinase)